MSRDNFDPYSEHHIEDPVTREAVEAALAATDPIVRKRPAVERIFGFTLIALVVVGLFGAVLSVIDNISIEKNNHRLHQLEDCVDQQNDAILQRQPSLIGEPCGNPISAVPFSHPPPTPSAHSTTNSSVRKTPKHKKVGAAGVTETRVSKVSSTKTIIVRTQPITKTVTATKSAPSRVFVKTKTVSPTPTCAVNVLNSCLNADSKKSRQIKSSK